MTLFRWNSFAPRAVASSAVAIILSGAACLAPDHPGVAAQGELACDVTYSNFAAEFFADYCLQCHSSVLVESIARGDAPLGVDFDTEPGALAFRDQIRQRACELGDMPPLLSDGPRPSAAEREMLRRWLECTK